MTDETAETALDSCKCGGQAEYAHEAFSDTVFVRCKKCGTRTRSVTVSIHDAEVIARGLALRLWNHAPADTETPA